MKAKHYLSEATVAQLRGLDLRPSAEDLNTVLENISGDLAHYIMRIDVDTYSTETSIAALGRMIYTAGARYKTRGTNALYRKTFESLVNANSFDIARELACYIAPIKTSLLFPDKAVKYAEAVSLGVRKLHHKAWLHSKWEGEVYDGEKGLLRAIRKVQRPRKPEPTVAVDSKNGTLIQQGSNFYQAKAGTESTHRMMVVQRFTTRDNLSTIAAGIGSLRLNEGRAPVFNLESDCDMYIVGQSEKGSKYLIGLPDTSVLHKGEELGVEQWKLMRLCNPNDKLRFVLEGVDARNNTLVSCHGMTPFYMPDVIRG